MRPIAEFLAEFRPPTPGSAPPILEHPAAAPGPAMPLGDHGPDPVILLARPDEADPADLPIAAIAAPATLPAPDIEALLAAKDAEHAAALAAARERWAIEEGNVLGERLARAFADLENRIADALAPLLEPFLSQAAQLKAVDQLRGMLATLFDHGDHRAVAVSGPADLVAVLKAHHGERPGAVFTETDGPDVVVVAGEARIRSHLGAWTRSLEAALGKAA